jgi:hypothetical protein
MRLFLTADDAHVDAELVAHGASELTAVLRLAHGARRHGDERVGLVAIGDALERAERVEPAAKDVGRDHAAPQRLAEPHHFLGAIEDLHAPARIHVRNDEVKRVRSDVECGDSHCAFCGLLLRRPRARVHVLFYCKTSARACGDSGTSTMIFC